MGRKSKYEQVKDDFPLIFQYLVQGLTEAEICIKLGISQTSLTKYKKENEEFRDLLKEGKKRPNAKVEQALYKSALGFEYEETKITTDGADKDAKVKIERTTKFIPGSNTAQIYWLKNREPDRFRERRDPNEVPPDERLKTMTDEELDREIEKLQKGDT